MPKPRVTKFIIVKITKNVNSSSQVTRLFNSTISLPKNYNQRINSTKFSFRNFIPLAYLNSLMNQNSTKNDIELPLLRSSSPAPKDQISLDIQDHSKSNLAFNSASKPQHLPYDPQKYSGRPPLLQWLTFTDMYPMLKHINNKARSFEATDIPKPEFRFNPVWKEYISIDISSTFG